MTPEKELLKDLAKEIHTALPEGKGFVLLTFDFGDVVPERRLGYISNANRYDVCRAMLEFISKTKGTYGRDV